jgi:hypothetical protein
LGDFLGAGRVLRPVGEHVESLLDEALPRSVGLSLTASVSHESTVRKLARRLGPDVIDEI